MAEPLGDIAELALCPRCRRPFDEAERPPKLLACRHHFCLACARLALGRGRELYCAHCWKRTEPPGGRADRLPTHRPVLALARRLRACLALAAPAPAPAAEPDPPPCERHAAPALWCCACGVAACRACGEHAPHAHALRPPHEARALLERERRALLDELRRLAARQRDFLLRALDAATALKLRLEAELAAPPSPAPSPSPPGAPGGSLAAAAAERDRLRARVAEAALRWRLDAEVCGAAGPLDEAALRGALAGPAPRSPPPERRDPLVFLGNYCAAALFARSWPARRADAAEAPVAARSPSPGVASPRPFPLFFFELTVDGAPAGRVVVEVRSDVAPRMARNFAALATGEPGVGYRGCAVFQCWENESVITGDFEQNDGRGGRSALEEGHFMPDDTRLAAVRGAVGMRRSQRRRDTLGLVGSQFRIVLREMRGFTAIFASVVEGLELVDRLSRAGDGAGKPHSAIVISSCGKLD